MKMFLRRKHGKHTETAPKISAADGKHIYTELTYNDDFGVPVIEAAIDGRTYRFILDTGASILCITDHVAKIAGFEIKKSLYRFKNFQGRLQTARVGKLTMGNIIVRDEKAVILSANNTIFRTLGIDGIIGGTVLAHFIVSFDARRRRIVITDDAARIPTSHDRWGRFRFWRALPLMQVGICDANGVEKNIKMLFDSGNGTGAVVMPSVKQFEDQIDTGAVVSVERGEGVASRMIGGLGALSKKLYRGRIGCLSLAGQKLNGIPVMSGGMAYPLLCWRLTSLGIITLDYPRKRYGFAPHGDVRAWKMTAYPVMTAVEKGRLIIASVWEPQLRRVISPGYEVTAIGPTSIANPGDTATPNIDELVPRMITADNSTVTITDTAGVKHILPSSLFIPE